MPADRARYARTLLALLLASGAASAPIGVAHAEPPPASTPTAPTVAPTVAPTTLPTASSAAPNPARALPDDDDDVYAEDPPAEKGSSWLGAGLAFGVLNLPKLGVGVTVLGEARPRRFWPLAFGLTYWFDNESELSDDQLDLGVHPLVAVVFPASGSRLIARAFQASAATCPYELQLASGALSLCGGVEGGILHVSSAGFVNEQAQTRATFAFDAYARWHFRFASSAFGITYSLGVFVPVLRDRFGFRDRNGAFVEQFQIAPVGGRLDVAFAYGF